MTAKNSNCSLFYRDDESIYFVRSHLRKSDFNNDFDEYIFQEEFQFDDLSGSLEIIIYDSVFENVFSARKEWLDISGTSKDFSVTVVIPIEPLPYDFCYTAYVADINLCLNGEEELLSMWKISEFDIFISPNKNDLIKHKTKNDNRENVKVKKQSKQLEEKDLKHVNDNNKDNCGALTVDGVETSGLNENNVKTIQINETLLDNCLKALYEIDSAEIAIFVRDKVGEKIGEEKYYIIHKTPTLHEPKNNLIYYSTLQAREVMSAAFRPEREGRGKYANKEFEVSEIIYKNQAGEVPYTTLAKEILIRSGGGKNTSIISNNYKVIDLLLYSPKTERYEIIKATHDAANRTCFIDLAIFKVFVKHFGNPGLPYRIGDGAGGNPEDATLNPESVLKGFGYSVAQHVGLSDKQRQDILADVVDLGILSVSKVIWYLELFIRLHPGANFYLAREKWERDEYFIANYSENPERFYIT